MEKAFCITCRKCVLIDIFLLESSNATEYFTKFKPENIENDWCNVLVKKNMGFVIKKTFTKMFLERLGTL